MRTLLYTTLALGLATTSTAGADAFMRIDGVDGGSVRERWRGWSDTLSFSHGTARPERGGAPRPLHVQVTKELDRASPALQRAADSGEVLPKITFQVTRTDTNGQEFVAYEVTLTSVRVIGYHVKVEGGGAARGTTPILEEIVLEAADVAVRNGLPGASSGTPPPRR